MQTIHPCEVRAILAPFVGAKLNRYETLAEYKTRPCVDISVGGWNIVDANVRQLGANSIERIDNYRGASEIIPFDKVSAIKVYRWSDDQRSQIVTGEYAVSVEALAA